jgi:Restriction endonuclease/ATP cone domain
MEKMKINITKASGETALFSTEKLRHSLKRSGADEDTISEIIHKVQDMLYEGITTKKIYKLAFDLLKKQSRHVAAKYKLKQAIMELGPSGFPFEKFFAAILSHQGYVVKVGEIVKGKCVNHEIDVIAEKENQHFMIECKYHNQLGTISNVKIPLYIQARFKDVEAAWVNIPGHGTKFHQGWVVTNTRFSDDAKQYGVCAGLKLIGWDYPFKENLKDMIDTMGLYPLTCLTTLTKREKVYLLEKNVVLCKEICHNPQLLKSAGITDERIKGILEEGTALCKNLTSHD